MKRIVAAPQKPGWLLKRNYARLRSLDSEGWLQELLRLYGLSVDHHLGLHKDYPNVRVGMEGSKTVIGIFGEPPVRLLEPKDEGLILLPTDLPVFIGASEGLR